MLQLNVAQLIARTVLARIDAAMSDLTLLEWADEDASGRRASRRSRWALRIDKGRARGSSPLGARML
jgi:hypothetical protein